MFRKSRQKIIALIMAILIVLLVGTLCVIYVSSYMEVYQKNQNMLAHHIELSAQDDLPERSEIPKEGQGPDDDDDGPPFREDVAFQLSTFYAVVLDEQGQVLETDNISTIYTDAELETIALEVTEEKSSGTYGSLVYRYEEKNGYTYVAFMDNTVLQESTTTLFRNTLLFGSIAIILMFFLAWYAAKKIVQPLEDSYKKQKQFISDAGHELKTPISVVSANAEILERELGSNQWLANIQYENMRMGVLVTQLLELARTEQIAPPTEKVNLSRIVTGEVLPLEPVAFEKGLTLQSEIANDVMVEGNAMQIVQMVSILLDNAICHSKVGGCVKLLLNREKGMATLSVVNEGAPIPEEQKNLLFQRFYRGDEARTGDENHYGLGLAIAQAIIIAHNGKIEVFCDDGLVEFKASFPAI